eukprot:Em0024g368a
MNRRKVNIARTRRRARHYTRVRRFQRISSEGVTTEPDVEAEPPPRPEVEPRRRRKRKAHRGEYTDFDKWLSPMDDALPGQAVAPKKSRMTKRQVCDLQNGSQDSVATGQISDHRVPAVFCLPGCIGPEVYFGRRRLEQMQTTSSTPRQGPALAAGNASNQQSDCSVLTSTGQEICRRFNYAKCTKGAEWHYAHKCWGPSCGISINDYIDKEDFPIHYVTVDDAVAMVTEYGKECIKAKIDLKAAFRMVPIVAEEWDLLGFHWKGKYYVDTCLPFSLRRSDPLGQMLSQRDRDHKPSHDPKQLGFFGLLRVSEFIVPNQHGFNPDQYNGHPAGGKLPDQHWSDTHQVLPTPCNAEIPRDSTHSQGTQISRGVGPLGIPLPGTARALRLVLHHLIRSHLTIASIMVWNTGRPNDSQQLVIGPCWLGSNRPAAAVACPLSGQNSDSEHGQ